MPILANPSRPKQGWIVTNLRQESKGGVRRVSGKNLLKNLTKNLAKNLAKNFGRPQPATDWQAASLPTRPDHT